MTFRAQPGECIQTLAVLSIDVSTQHVVPSGTSLIVTLYPQYIIVRFCSITNWVAWALEAITRVTATVITRVAT